MSAYRRDQCLARCCSPCTSCSPVADVISEHGVSYHQYADDTHLRLSLRADNTAEGLAVLATCTADVRQWYLRNGLQLNPDKSEALIIGTTNQRQVATASLSSVTVAGVDLPVADEMKVLGDVLDCRLSFDRHTTSVTRACNYHVQAIRHIRRLLTTEVAVTPEKDFFWHWFTRVVQEKEPQNGCVCDRLRVPSGLG